MIFQVFGAPQLSALHIVTFMTQVLKCSVMHVSRSAYENGFLILKPAKGASPIQLFKMVVASTLRDLNYVLPDLKDDPNNNYLVFVTDSKEVCIDYGLALYPLSTLGVDELTAIGSHLATAVTDLPDRLVKVADTAEMVKDSVSVAKSFIQQAYPLLYRFTNKEQRRVLQKDFVYTLVRRKSWPTTGLVKLDDLMKSPDFVALSSACLLATKHGLTHALDNLNGAEESDVRYVVNRFLKLEANLGNNDTRPNRRTSKVQAQQAEEVGRKKIKVEKRKAKAEALRKSSTQRRSLFS